MSKELNTGQVTRVPAQSSPYSFCFLLIHALLFRPSMRRLLVLMHTVKNKKKYLIKLADNPF